MPTPPADRPATRVLLVDDDPDDFVLTRDRFAEIPGDRYALDWVPEYDAGLAALTAGTHDVVLVDYRLGAKSGLDLLADAHRLGCSIPIIMLTGQSVTELDILALDRGAADFLEKSKLEAAHLDRSIRYALQQKRYEAELERQVRERTAELKRANESLQLADKAKDEFLATLAHELRNPLAPIRNALEIMRLAADDPAALENSRQMIDRQVRLMVRLVDDLLDVSRITRGKLQLNLETVTLQDVLTGALEQSRPKLEQAGLELKYDPPAASVRLSADRVRLGQVFSNLFNNAAKYTERGGQVTVVVEPAADHVAVTVRDTGVGIPSELLPHIFDLFTQVDRTLNRADGGLGIGLALVQRLTEMHHGRVSAHSNGVGTGAEFTVRLPVAR